MKAGEGGFSRGGAGQAVQNGQLFERFNLPGFH